MGWLYFLVGIATLAGIYAAFALTLNLTGGWAGLWDLGPAGLLAVGAYVYVITTVAPAEYSEVRFVPGWPIWAGILAAGVCTGVVALIVGAPALRVRGEYFLITTFAFAEVIRQIIVVEASVTRGPNGFSGLDRPFDGLVSGRDYRFILLGIVAVVVAALVLLMRRLSAAPFVRVLRATRDNEVVALSLGKNVARYRIQTFVLSGVLLGLVAPVYVWYVRALVPQLFVSDLTFTIWIALIIGGIGSVWGAVLGAIVLVGLTELIELLQVSAEHANLLAAARPFILGVVLIAIIRLRPQGIIPERWSFRNASRLAGRSA
jgi:branched-chain amino acid transport system permease protein